MSQSRVLVSYLTSCSIIAGIITTIDAMMLGFKVFFVGDLTVTRTGERHEIALEVLDTLFAKVTTFDEAMKELEQLAERK